MAEQPSRSWSSGGSAAISSWSGGGSGAAAASSSSSSTHHPQQHGAPVTEHSRKRGLAEKQAAATAVRKAEDPAGGKRGRPSAAPSSASKRSSSRTVPALSADQTTVHSGDNRNATNPKSSRSKKTSNPQSSKLSGGKPSTGAIPKVKRSSQATSTSTSEVQSTSSERGRRAVTIASSAATNSTVLQRKLQSDSNRKRGLSTQSSSSTSSLTSQPANKKAATSSAQPSTSTASSATSPKKYPLRNQVRLLPGSQEPVPLEVPLPPPEYYPPPVRRRSYSAGSPKPRNSSRGRSRASIASPYHLTDSQQLGKNSTRGAGVSATAPQHQAAGSKDNLRRSSRSKTTTGSCASSSGRRSSRGGTKLPLASSSQSTSSVAPGPSSFSASSSTHPAANEPAAAIMNASSGGDGWEGLAEAAASSSSAAATRVTPPPPLPPLLLASSSGGPSLLATAATAGSAQQGGAASASSAASAAATAAAAADSESDDSEVGLSCTSPSAMLLQSNSSGSSSQLLARTASSVGRLQALLESRGLPPHLFGALGPRMQHLLHRSMGGSGASSGSSSKVQQLLTGLASLDETVQLSAVIEMCQMLVMGNEDTLAGFPIKQVVPALINLLSMEHNFDMMNHACRALTYMMEALPRSSVVVVDAVPCFLEKLQVIQCMDVAEQSLTALEMLSRRHGKAILQARGVSSCLTYLDFFSINAQRAALATTANCCMNLHPDEFHLVSDSLPVLASRLTQQDKRSIESVCLAFSRLVDSFQLDANRLQTIASPELLANLQRILVVSPQIISTGTFITVLRMLSVMCANCPSLARELLRHNVADTLLFLLTGNATTVSNNEDVDLVSRSPQELYEITCLIGELMPRLPTDGLFAVDALIERPVPVAQDAVTWQWRDDRELWHSYSSMDSRIIEASHQAGEDEISLPTLGRTYTIDFHSMQQINEDTGTTRPVLRRVLPIGGLTLSGSSGSAEEKMDAESEEDKELAAGFVRSLFSVLYEVYSSSAGPAVRCKCLKALLRMVHFASADLLKEVLRNQVVSSHLAGMLASQDLRIVVGALQMAYTLMEKLPAEFGIHFRREGVMHQIKHLSDTPLPQTPGAPSSSTTNSPAGDKLRINPPPAELQSAAARNLQEPLESDAQSSSHIVIGDALKRKRNGGKRCASTTSSRKTRPDEVASSSASMPSASFQPNLPSGYFKVKPFAGNSPSSSSSNRTGTPSSVASSSSNSSPDPFALLGATASASGGASSGGTPNRSRFSGAKATFFASLNPAKWGRSSATSSSSATASSAVSASAFGVTHNGHASEHRLKELSHLNKSCSVGGIAAGNKEKARAWVRDQAQKFVTLYFDNDESNGAHPALNVLSRLTQAIDRLQSQPWQGDVALADLKDIVLTSDISPFEVNHSGLIGALLHYLTFDPNQEASAAPLQSSGSQNNNNNIELETSEDSLDQKPHPPRDLKLRVFLNVFANCPKDAELLDIATSTGSIAAFSALVAKLGGCIAQLEQFPVKVHDLPTGTSGGRTGGTSALKFFNTHQLKCNLQRHPSCNTLKQWKGGTVKIDPLALVQAIERYLVVRGYGRLRDKDTVDSDDETEEDIDDTLAAVVISQNNARHKLQFLIGDNPLPYNMTVYQAVRQFSVNAGAFGNDQSETDTDSEVPLGNTGLWVQTHTIYYRPAPEDGPAVPSSSRSGTQPLASTSSGAPSSSGHHRKGKSSSKSSSRRSKESSVRMPACPLSQFLLPRLPENVTINDASLDVLCLLRVLHALSRYWGSLYQLPFCKPLLTQQEFVSNKISAKASRQLQDPLVIMTGNLPAWLQQVASACPFLFPFEVRQLLFYATSFDRDRALQRLLEASPELNSAEAHERVTPRLDRRKRTVSRSDILRQAEQVVQDLATSRALLEVQYENEVGTGLGPTLEFYALVSRELQRADLELWLGEAVPGGVDGQTQYVHSVTGLFPMPLGKNAKVVQLARVKAKFRFLGRLMAKAVMDSRMLDMPFSQTLYRVLLGEQNMLSLPDLVHVSPSVHATLARLQPLARQHINIERDQALGVVQKKEAQDKLALDGCPVADLGLDFTLPGYPNVELKKGGKDLAVTIHNLDLYIKLVCHWFLVEGIAKQVEALRDGFEAVFPLEHLRLFYPEELEAVFCGSPMGPTGAIAWDIKTLMECCRPDHGYTPDSRAIRFLFEVLSSYNQEEQRKFLQFVTGSPRLPVGGFKSLNPPLTVVRKTLEPNMDPDDFLPSVMTCVNYLKLPDYSSIEVMRAKLQVAAQEGQHSFHLS
ncbi:E3 ubiquitin-protein ligase TRIP12 isoform X2 [Neocloeon triangulifer]|uniref:E3 ubiquitin-protein ligase TRIP12 isoform X2 n=1 Tax=Neocloeon triangulifer TaxID=2078957 RepID=UPI00286EF246|nr:E3 ubiquitin-protein ligase TRIP12 isoform X2 [Neocloeon triangulifer]